MTAARVGIGGPVGSGKTALIERLLDVLQAQGTSLAVITNDLVTNEDAERLRAMGVARVYTPKDFELNRIMFDVVELAHPTSVAAE